MVVCGSVPRLDVQYSHSVHWPRNQRPLASRGGTSQSGSRSLRRVSETCGASRRLEDLSLPTSPLVIRETSVKVREATGLRRATTGRVETGTVASGVAFSRLAFSIVRMF